MEQHIKITIDEQGTSSIEAVDFRGGACKVATAPYEKIYDQKIEAHDKPELYLGAACPVGSVHAQ